MSTFVLHNTAVIAGCRAASSSRTRVVSVVRAPSAVRIGTTPGALKTAMMAANRDGSRSTMVRASEDEAPAAESTAAPAAREPEEDSEEVKGAKLTAIVTGVVSVVLAVAYLGLVQVLDSREMLPPPPEAMGQGDWESTRQY